MLLRETTRNDAKQCETTCGYAGGVDAINMHTQPQSLPQTTPAQRVAGQATVSADGETHDVTEPEVIDAATPLPMLSPKQRRTFECVGIAEYLGLIAADFHAVFYGALRAPT
jgi:hypothetical protein